MQRAHQKAHARLWLVLAVVIPLMLVLGLARRGVAPEAATATRLDAPVQGAGQ